MTDSIWIVVGSSGRHDEYAQWNVTYRDTEEDARLEAARLNSVGRSVAAWWNVWLDEHPVGADYRDWAARARNAQDEHCASTPGASAPWQLCRIAPSDISNYDVEKLLR